MAGLRFRCPKCQSERVVNQRAAGRRIRCPACDGLILIPEPPPAAKTRGARGGPSRAEPSLVSAAVHAPAATAAGLPHAGFSGRDASAGAASAPDHSRHDPHSGSTPLDPLLSEELEDEPVSLPVSRNEDTEMDMTPMVDVTFLLLIFFMITAAFASEKVIQQQTSPKDAAQPRVIEVVDTLTIRIDELNTFLVMLPDLSELEAPSKQDLIVVLDESRKEGLLDDVENVVIEAHEDSIHSSVVAALDACGLEELQNFRVKIVEEFD